ncbi:MAG: VWA domain-containing protein [Oscillospiraceae bacterium]|jgi:uncharacterized protein YegL|nr:VWA domain-containing protein [Oscillospiraceae bacterium]
MTNNITEIAFILDRSSSMGGLESDTIGGYNSFLKKQQEQPGEAHITTVLFDSKYELLHDRLDLRAVSPITEHEYYVRGCTALLDAIGKTINKIGNAQKHTAEEYRAGKVLFVITTDGMENASREFDYAKIKSMIEHQKSRHGWEFIFLGANIDAVETAGWIGITPDRAQNYHADSEGVALNFHEMSETVSMFRIYDSVPSGWNKKIKADYKRRDDKKK